MSDKIMSRDEAEIRMILLKSTVKYLKVNHIKERSEMGQTLNDFESHLATDLIDHLIDSDKK